MKWGTSINSWGLSNGELEYDLERQKRKVAHVVWPFTANYFGDRVNMKWGTNINSDVGFLSVTLRVKTQGCACLMNIYCKTFCVVPQVCMLGYELDYYTST